MENVFKLEDIKETGYNNWTDFYFNVKSWGSQNDKHSFEYYTPSKKELKQIEFTISINILKALALEEAKQLLQVINIKSFKDLWENHKDKLTSNRNFEFNIIVKEKNGEVYVRKLSFDSDRILLLIDLEERHTPYLVYDLSKQSCSDKN